MNIKEKCKKILEYYGEEAQANQYVQELGELLVGLTKNDLENVKEEIADVDVMTEQFLMFKGIKINSYKRLKKHYSYDDIDKIEWIEKDLKLSILKVLENILEKNMLFVIFHIAEIENLINRYMKLKEIDRQDIEKIKEQKIDRQLKRIEREKVNK